jgi:Transglycosylase-like domain
LLTKHTYSVLALIAVLALPPVAVGAGREGDRAQHIGIGDAHPAALDVLYRPATDFHHAIDVGLKRIRDAHRAEQRRHRREAFATLPGGVSLSTLEAIASCESGGDPTIVSSDGTYRGKYQFSYETWASVGGSGDPAAAPEAEQDYRAALLYTASGSSPWPICGS